MVAYLALTWTGTPPPVVRLTREALQTVADWSLALEAPGLLLALRGPVRARVRGLPVDRGWVVGDLFRRDFGPVSETEADHLMISRRSSVRQIAERLQADYWGRYVALIREPDGTGTSLYRDPSGAAEVMAWTAGGVGVAASHLPDWLPAVVWPALDLDWGAVAAWLRSQSAAAITSGLRSVRSVTPGALANFTGLEDQLWRPAEVATRGRDEAAPSGEGLRGLVDGCVAALAGEASAILGEISGGLDSAIVAASLAASHRDRVRQWLNLHAADGPGDERRFARDVATLWDLELTEGLKAPFQLDAAFVEAGAGGLRPDFNGMDGGRVREMSERIDVLGVDRVLTGQGGDMVFFQTPTPLLVADLVRLKGPLNLFSPYAAEVSRWTRQSIWRTAGQALRPDAAWTGEASVRDHPWMTGARRLPPAKRSQIAILAHKLTDHIENLQGRRAELVHPLLAQPIVEHCLAIPAPRLTEGGRDRGLARRVFSDRLPISIRERRAKGELTSFYGRMLGASLDFLRPYLLEGRLADQGLIDRATFDAMLQADALMWRGGYSAIMNAVTVEAWVRVWSAKRPP